MRKVEIIKPYGYCAGVVRAINLAKIAKEENKDKNVYILGQLVHNSIVLNYLNNLGIKTLYEEHKSLLELIKKVKKDDVVVLSAHGHPKEIDEYIKKKNIKYYDATCPKVNLNFEMIKKYIALNHQVIFVGVANHPESKAATSISNNVFLYDINLPFNYHLITDNAPLVVNQTTLNYVDLIKIHSHISKHIKGAKIMDEICNATRIRQENIINLNDDTDAFIVVGDYNSSNTNRLFEIAKNTHKDALVLLIQKADDLDISVLKDKKNIAICSGTSTPVEVVDDIYKMIVDLD